MTMTQEELLKEEERIESSYRQDGYEAMLATINGAKEKGEVDSNLAAGQGMFHWRAYKLTAAIKDWLETQAQPKAGAKPSYAFLVGDLARAYKVKKKGEDVVDYDAIAGMMSTITLSTVINQLCSYGTEQHPLNNVAYAVASAIENEYRTRSFANWLRDKEDDNNRGALKGINYRVGKDYRKEYLIKAIKNCGYPDPTWYKTRQKEMRALGVHLLMIAQAVTGYFDIKSAHHVQDYMIATEAFSKAWQKNEDNMLYHAHKLCPMVVPPAAWSRFDDGGYYFGLSEFNYLLRLKEVSSSFGTEYMHKIAMVDMPGVYEAINALQATPWKINKQVLEVVKACREQGYIPNGKEKAAGYVISLKEDTKPAYPPEGATEEEIKVYKEKAVAWHKSEKRRLSLQNRANGIINIADKFKDYENIYFPANMDFRGRCYFIPNFSPQGDDLCKGLLLFNNVPPCSSEEDIKFLAIAGAGFAGVDKASYDDRIKWIKDHEAYIMQSAEDPLGGKMWWLKQDKKPTQLLAFCFEWKRAKEYMEAHNGSIVGFKTGLVYAQDGTCSGLQHFSAILRDSVGGKAVNLVPQDKPNDVYQQVADKVNVVLLEDAVSGEPDEWVEDKLILGSKTKAQIWLNYAERMGWGKKIKRTVTKRCTMTLAYGARKFGYKEMLLEDIIKPAMDREMKENCPFTRMNANSCALYMANLIWDAVGKTVIKAREGMDWLQKVAQIVTREANVVSWTTPMGLLLQQNYAKYEKEVVKLSCMGKRYRIYVPRQTGEIDSKKQAQAIAPNFIHSMDACHLQMTICDCLKADIHHFAMVHDSYGCPISQAKLMYSIVRDCFVKMYTENDVLMNFKNELQELTDTELPDPPEKGDFALEQVKESKYIFC